MKATKLLSIGALSLVGTLSGIGFTKILQNLELLPERSNIELMLGGVMTFLVASGTQIYFSAKNAHRTKEDMERSAIPNSEVLKICATSLGGTAVGIAATKLLEHVNLINEVSTYQLTTTSLATVMIASAVQLYFADKKAEENGKLKLEEERLSIKNSIQARM